MYAISIYIIIMIDLYRLHFYMYHNVCPVYIYVDEGSRTAVSRRTIEGGGSNGGRNDDTRGTIGITYTWNYIHAHKITHNVLLI